MRLPHSFVVLLSSVLASSALTNTTFDDSSSSFTFSEGWTAITPSSPCDFCNSKPDDLSQVYDGTWHDGNYAQGASSLTTGSFTFQGSAVYIFGIDQATSQPNIVFTLGNTQHVHHYTGTERFAYHALFFSAEDLPSDQTHTVNWVFELADTGVGVQAALFDYAIVTTGQEGVVSPPSTTVPPSQPSNDNNNNSDNNKPAPNSGSSSSTISTSRPSGSQSKNGASQSSNGVGQSSSGAGQFKSAESQFSPTGSPVDQGSTPTVTVSGLTTVTAPGGAISKSKSNLGAIIGGVIGGLAVIALGMLFVWIRLRRVRHVKSQTDATARTQFLRIEDYPGHTRQIGSVVPVSLSTSSPKGQNISEAALAGPSTTSLLIRQDGHATEIPDSTSSSSPSEIESPVMNDVPSGSGRDLQLMEERLATLEAQLAAQQQLPPPPYIHEDDD